MPDQPRAGMTHPEYDAQVTEVLRSQGLCGAVGESRACLLDEGHSGPHGWVTERIDFEAIARRFHEVYEHLAPSFGYETRDESAVPWEVVPDANKHLMVAVVAQLIGEGVIRA